MDNLPKYTLLVKNDENDVFNNFIDELNKKYLIYNDEDLIADIVLDLKNLKLYHGYNNEIICHLENLNSLNILLSIEIEDLIKKADLDMDSCVQMLGGSIDVFLNLCRNYLSEYNNANDNILNLFINNEINQLHKALHKIKGVSYYVGGEKFYKVTSLIETKVLCGEIKSEEIEYFINYHCRMLKNIKEVVENVQ